MQDARSTIIIAWSRVCLVFTGGSSKQCRQQPTWLIKHLKRIFTEVRTPRALRHTSSYRLFTRGWGASGNGWRIALPLRKCFCCMGLFLRMVETAFRKSEIWRNYQPHLDFTKPTKVGHLGVGLPENDSLAHHYSKRGFHSPSLILLLLLLLLLSPLSLLSSPFLFISPPFPICPWCYSWVGGMEGRWRQGGTALQQSSFIFSLQGCNIKKKTQRVVAVIQQNQDTAATAAAAHQGCISFNFISVLSFTFINYNIFLK